MGAMSWRIMPSEASPPCIGDASPLPISPLSACTRTKALRCAGRSVADHATWNASTLVIFMDRVSLGGKHRAPGWWAAARQTENNASGHPS
jgi:hypothetical protein